MDTSVFNKLIDVLEQEIKVYDGIFKISKSKTNIIVEGKVSELENITKLEQSLAMQMGTLEDTREKLVDTLAAAVKLDPANVTISELASKLNPEQGEKLKACQTRMVEVLDELKNVNLLNSKLIRNSLDYIDFSINLFSAAEAANNNYGNTGQVNDSKKRNFFDVKL